jgi:nucleoid-associated protein YgaU
MNLKDLLKAIKLNESTISTVLGILVVVVVGIFVVNYFRSIGPGDTLPTGVNTEDLDSNIKSTYTVKEGDSLWTIAEQVYGDGYKWVEIQKVNSLTDANSIETGQVLKIPSVETEATGLAEATEAPTATLAPTPSQVATAMPEATEVPTEDDDATASTAVEITGERYTVVRGDNLWDIAERAYGDGFQWVKIAEANELVNPDIIHAGNVFSIPR